MKSWLRLLLVILGLAALIGIAAALLAQTRVRVAGSSVGAGQLELETALPLATCRKTLRLAYPFVQLTCNQSEGAEPPGSAP